MWARVLSVALGLWLMAAPAVLDYGEPARTVDRIVGPIVASFSYVALWQVIRELRWANVPLGIGLLVAPLVFRYDLVPLLNSILVGAALIALARAPGKVTERFGGGWASLHPGRRDRPSR